MGNVTFGTTAGNDILNAILNNTAMQYATPFLSLHTADPGATGANEASGGSYARINTSTDWPGAASKTLDNDNEIEFTDLAAGTYTHIGVWSASSGGTFYMGGPLNANVVVGAGGAVRFPAGDIDWTID